MVYGVIDKRSKSSYTYLSDVFAAIHNRQRDYNWLICDCEIIAGSDELDKLNKAEFSFLSGDELTAIVEKDDAQWIWGVLIGFDINISPDEILAHPIPRAENPDIWKAPVSLQHPLSSIEIIPFDSSCVLFITREKELIDLFRSSFPDCEYMDDNAIHHDSEHS